MSGAAVDALVERAARLRWLAPDAALDALGPEAKAWARDRADEHIAALAPFLDGAVVAPRARFTRELADANARWDAAWAEGQSTPYALALHRARRRLDDDASLGARAAEAWAARDRVRAALPAPDRWHRLLGQGTHGELPGAVCAELHAGWLAAFADEPSPWGPLFELWERGAWPMALPDGSLFVYVPLVANGVILPSAATPRRRPGVPLGVRDPWDPDPIPLRRPRPALGPGALFPRVDLLGCGPAPGRDEPLPPPLPPPMLAGAVPPVGPLPTDATPIPPMRLAGAPLPVSLVSPVPPLPAPPDAPKPEPWYKRLFR